MASVHDVAAAVLEEHGRAMSTMKLQKLVYYCQAWHLVWREEPLFSETIQAWAGGPVVYQLYKKHRGAYSVSEWDGDPDALRKRERRTVRKVVDAYGRLDGRDLSMLTHRELPWRLAREGMEPGERGNRPIDTDVMASYYASVAAEDDTVPIEELAAGEIYD